MQLVAWMHVPGPIPLEAALGMLLPDSKALGPTLCSRKLASLPSRVRVQGFWVVQQRPWACAACRGKRASSPCGANKK